MIPANVAIAVIAFTLAGYAFLWFVLRAVFRRRWMAEGAEEQRVIDYPDVLTAAEIEADAEARRRAPGENARAARVPDRTELLERTQPVSEHLVFRDELGHWVPRDWPLASAAIHVAVALAQAQESRPFVHADGAELVVVEPPPFPRRPRRGRLAANETATGPGWIGPTPAAKTQEVA